MNINSIDISQNDLFVVDVVLLQRKLAGQGSESTHKQQIKPAVICRFRGSWAGAG
jgi:hypothetical protein